MSLLSRLWGARSQTPPAVVAPVEPSVGGMPRGRNPRTQGRTFDALRSESMGDISSLPVNSNEAIRTSLSRMRAISRSMCLNDSYAKKYLTILQANLVGENGIRPRCDFKDHRGKLKTEMNRAIEREFKVWSRIRNCDVTRKLGWVMFQRLLIQHIARDGEGFVRFVIDPERSHGLALQLLDPCLVDENLNVDKGNGRNRITAGIEIDEWGAPVAYHLLSQAHTYERRHVRLLAEDILHLFQPLFAGQVRGVPWLHASMLRMHNTSRYEQAELVAARLEASKVGFLIPGEEDEGTQSDAFDDDGNLSMDVRPGSLSVLERGMKLETWDPNHPNGNAESFVRSSLQGTASGLDVSYASLSSDLSRVNFSSIRHGELKDRDRYKLDQEWLISAFCEPVFERWVETAMLKGKIPVRPTEIELYKYPSWLCKRWDWVDPLKDTNASIAAVDAGLKSRTQIVAEMGRDFEDVARELAEEEKLARSLGINLKEKKEEKPGDEEEEAGDDEEGEAA